MELRQWNDPSKVEEAYDGNKRRALSFDDIRRVKRRSRPVYLDEHYREVDVSDLACVRRCVDVGIVVDEPDTVTASREHPDEQRPSELAPRRASSYRHIPIFHRVGFGVTDSRL